MSQYYQVPRGAAWNYGGQNWKLSRSKIDLFINCPKCFYLDNKLGVKRPPGYPFNLNTAVDTLLKQEFDTHRAEGTQHPLIEKYGIDAHPVAHPDLDKWRENFVGVQYTHEPTGFTISGAIDDLWQNSTGGYIVVDYKATSKKEAINELNQDFHRGYKRQMEVYQWLLRMNGLTVSDTGYFVYCNGIDDKEAFDGKLEFDVTLIPYTGNDDWVGGKLEEIHKCLLSEVIPEPDPECDYCKFVEYREKFDKSRKNDGFDGKLF